MSIKIYLDGASLSDMEKYAGVVSGFTTNPSLMRASLVRNYAAFAKDVLARAGGKPVSFEVLADDWDEMERQANIIAGWGDNVWVKIPVMNSQGEASVGLISRLRDLRLNITAVMTDAQIVNLGGVVQPHHIVSVFAGRIADTMHDPWFRVEYAAKNLRAQILWASPRQVRDVLLAEQAGAHIITLPPSLIAKLALRDKDLHAYSRETVQQFVEDAKGIQF